MMTAKRKRLKKLPRNSVVAYHGGGYDGCFWEWNFAYVDAKGKFYDIFSSGRKAITDGKSLLEALNVDPENEIDVYDMGDEDERQRMANSESVFNAGRLANFFAVNDKFGVTVKLKCDCCGEWVEPEGCEAEGIHGCGGIMVGADDIICPECHSNHTCWHCGEYDSAELVGEITKDDGTVLELNGQTCQWCAEDFKSGRRSPE